MDKYLKNIKSFLAYLSTIFSWALFCILTSSVLLLAIYFVDIRTRGKGSTNISIYTIVSGSMIPTINVYDVIVNKKVTDPDYIKEGDVITFISTSPISSGMTVTHRVIDIQIINGEYQYVTKGDNNVVRDTSPALYKNLIGKAIFKIPQLGRIQFFVASKYGWFLIVILPAGCVIAKDIFKIIKMTRLKNEADKENKKE